MTSILTLRRAFVINRVLIRHGLDEFLAPTPLSRIMRILKIFALSGNRNKSLSRGQRLNQALTELGPIFIKLGQMLSTRRDLLADDLADELAKLQDNVQPFDSETARQLVERELGQPIEALFSQFDQTPLASASIAQVHSAQLISGEQVVVKIIRPKVRKKIVADLKLLHLLAGWFERYSSTARRLKVVTIIKDYQTTILNELDLRIEAANTSQLKRNFAASELMPSPLLYVPRVYWDLSRKNVMVQEKIHGIPIGNIERLRQAGVDMQCLAHRGVEIFFTQVFMQSYFHADMHPGNIFVDANDPLNPKYIAVDCGIMGTLSESDKRYLAQNFVAFFNGDYRKIAELHIDSGWISAKVSLEQFEAAIRTACEPIIGKPLAEISFGHFLVQLFQTARQFDMQVQPQLVLLQKTLLYIEGLGRQLYPNLDLWKTAQPFLKNWLKQTYGTKAVIEKLKNAAPIWFEQLPEMPTKLNQLLEHELEKKAFHRQLIERADTMRQIQSRNTHKISWGLLGLALIVASLLDTPHWLASESIKNVLLSLSLVSFVLSFKSR